MSDYPRHAAVHLVRHPIHPLLVPFPIACFVGTLLTDVAYWRTAEMMWADFSAWLVSAGVVLGLLAAIAGLIDFLSNRLIREEGPAWPHVIGNAVVLVLGILNMLVHTHDAWTSVIPWGLALSALTVVLIFFTAWMGRTVAYRTGVEVMS